MIRGPPLMPLLFPRRREMGEDTGQDGGRGGGRREKEVEAQAGREVRCGACVLGPCDSSVQETVCQSAEILLHCGILGM